MKNLHKHKNLMGFIYAIVMLLPFCTILARTLYTQLNKNAYQSYSNNGIKESYKINNTNISLIENEHYYIFNGMTKTTTGTGWVVSYKFTYDNASVDLQNYFDTDFIVDGIGYATDGNATQYFRFYLHNKSLDTWININGVTNYTTNPQFIQKINNLNFEFRLLTYDNDFYKVNNIIYYITNNDTLDNAFEYSIDKTISNSNIGKLNLTNWFVDIFLDDTNATNMRYINFVNWYMNYSLLVSCVYLLYMVLMWFLTFARKLLSKGFNEEI